MAYNFIPISAQFGVQYPHSVHIPATTVQPVRVLKTERDIPVETLTLVSEFDKVTVKVYDLEFRRVTAKLYAFAYLIEVAMGGRVNWLAWSSKQSAWQSQLFYFQNRRFNVSIVLLDSYCFFACQTDVRYTASSELLPLLAAGRLPLLKVDKITQTIDTSSSTIINSTTLSSPFASLSFSASSSFEVQSPTRIQVAFKEGSIQAPDIKSNVELPENVDIFGQKLNLQPLQQSLGPLQGLVENISRVISGQPPLKIPIPGEKTSSWLLTTYLDKDLRISRGDGGLFVLAREGK
ncbi:plastoglobulin-1, chloroplastic [Glycine max]|uniref:plastoglobulin-1, chloroplastic n=1 Tax=Glycine max TaxID=3847 RepID=UPI0003DEB0AD|nr:plastoglobulin-1, chloroplastic-like [Glycine max]|eukprot:XP_025979725.1 plastoglobulin-1, chloroplastic-like [Glycine max]